MEKLFPSLLDGLIKFLTFILDRIAHKRNLKNVSSIVDIYSAMQNVISEECDPPNTAVQFLVLKAENGGKSIKPGSQLFLSCLYESYRAPVGSSMRYQRVHIDGDYMQAVLSCMQNKVIKFKTKDLKQDSIMRNMNEAEDILYTEMYYLYDKKESIYFCLISTTVPDSSFVDARQRMTISLAVDTIRDKIKKAV